MSGLLSAELNLSISNLRLPRAFSQVLKGDLLIIVSPSMRKYSIRGDIVNKILSQAEFAMTCDFQKTHY